ncbi:hypothetical protein SD457_08070 [Coprobacillaceae bacterium CR2/5/TPMF4]|nr:hypothetical protein SD457_08070 [Coprobacillaceae bacterium CR2/5/TPMF4]
MLTFAGINLISGSSNAIINSLAPLVTVLLAWLFIISTFLKIKSLRL